MPNVPRAASNESHGTLALAFHLRSPDETLHIIRWRQEYSTFLTKPLHGTPVFVDYTQSRVCGVQVVWVFLYLAFGDIFKVKRKTYKI